METTTVRDHSTLIPNTDIEKSSVRFRLYTMETRKGSRCFSWVGKKYLGTFLTLNCSVKNVTIPLVILSSRNRVRITLKHTYPRCEITPHEAEDRRVQPGA